MRYPRVRRLTHGSNVIDKGKTAFKGELTRMQDGSFLNSDPFEETSSGADFDRKFQALGRSTSRQALKVGLPFLEGT